MKCAVKMTGSVHRSQDIRCVRITGLYDLQIA